MIPDFSRIGPGTTGPGPGPDGASAWARAVEDATGKGPDALVWETPEGIGVKPLYTPADRAGLDFVHRQLAWSRRVPLDTHLANLASYSDFLVLGAEGTAAFLAEERGLLSAAFPDGTVEERYVVSLAVARH